MRTRDILLIAIAAILVLGGLYLFWYGGSNGWFRGPAGEAGLQGPRGEQGEQGPSGPTAEVVVVQPTPTAEADAEETGSGNVLFRLSPEGIYLNWVDEKEQFLQEDGTYMVPVAFLVGLAPDSAALVFEGEYWDTIGEHHVCILVLDPEDYANACETELVQENGVSVEVFHINQGSFWGYIASETGWTADDLLRVFAWNKWKNGDTQTPKISWLIIVHLSNADMISDHNEPNLTQIEEVYVQDAEAVRCPADSDPLLEEPYSDSSGGHAVVGAPGSYSCMTLFVGHLTEDGEVVALYWFGAKDLFGYWSEGAAFYLIPVGWGEAEMQDFVTEELGDGIDVSPY